MADFNRVKQVLLNIIKNSKEAIIEDGNIDIDLYKNKKFVYIKITDNGIGMDHETLDKLYTPF